MSSAGGDDNNVVQFPTTPEERRALHRAKQEAERKRLANLFVDEAAGDHALFRTPSGECYADLIIEGARQTWPVRSKTFRAEYVRYMRRQFERLIDASAPLASIFGPALKKSSINAMIEEFELRAICSNVEREVHVRVASDGDHLYIDLGDPQWHAVRITGAGWTVVQSPPVRFRRTPDTRTLPFPEHGTSISALQQFLPNIGSEDEFILVLAFLLAALQPRGPYPIFIAYGEHGLGKTDLLRILRALTDPNKVMTAPLPSSSRDLYIAARNSHIQAFENVSRISDAMSDNLCRLATGGGMRTRALWTNSDETTFAGARPIMAEGITNFVTRPDLLDRAIIFAPKSLPNRKTVRELWTEFDWYKAGIFGALCDMLATGVRQLPETHLVSPCRMADFATWSVACGLDTFEAAYARNRQNAIDVILEHDILAQSVEALQRTKGEWRGTATELLNQIGPTARITLPKVLSDQLRRLAPMLRTHNVRIEYDPRTADRREIRIFGSSNDG